MFFFLNEMTTVREYLNNNNYLTFSFLKYGNKSLLGTLFIMALNAFSLSLSVSVSIDFSVMYLEIMLMKSLCL